MRDLTDGPKASHLEQWTVLDKFVLARLLAHDRSLARAALRVGIELSNHYNTKTSRCDPSIKRLSELLHIDRRTVQHAVRELEEHGWLMIGRCTGKNGTNQYLPNFAHARVLIDKVQPKGAHAVFGFIETQCPPGRRWIPPTPGEIVV